MESKFSITFALGITFVAILACTIIAFLFWPMENKGIPHGFNVQIVMENGSADTLLDIVLVEDLENANMKIFVGQDNNRTGYLKTEINRFSIIPDEEDWNDGVNHNVFVYKDIK